MCTKVLQIEGLDFHAVENALNHQTQKYELVTDQHVPVLRRCQNFLMTILSKNRALDLNSDLVTLIFEFGSAPSVTKGTKVAIPLDHSRNSHNTNPAKWDAIIRETREESTTVKIQIGCNAPVGVWKCQIETWDSQRSEEKSMYVHPGHFYIIFNPYGKHDAVFMADEEERLESVERDEGNVWIGSYKNECPRAWSFGQFEDSILPACCHLLKKGGLKDTDMGNPIKVTRAISAIVNSNDDHGIIKGKWEGPYGDGTHPMDWSGSVAIIEAYMKCKKPVKYGQCWVYAAVVVTICRALGLPCRSVTNYSSGHDKNSNMRIDMFFDEFGKKEKRSEKVWTFHVWNDVWMARPDLSGSCEGWQTIDSTPLGIPGNKIQCCGPSPVCAVRKGELGHCFDCSFIFSEVNAPVYYFHKDPTSSWGYKQTKVLHWRVGRMILTDRRDGPCNITDQYKNKGISSEDKLAIIDGACGVRTLPEHDDQPEVKDDVFMELVHVERGKLGCPFMTKVNLENRSAEIRTLKVTIIISSVFHTGTMANTVKESTLDIFLEPGERRALELEVSPEEYMKHLVDHCMIKFGGVIHVSETKQIWSDEDDFTLEKPKISIDVRGKLTIGKPHEIHLILTNPLRVPLTGCTVIIECAGAVKPFKETVECVGPGATLNHTLTVTPRRAVAGTFVAVFTSKEVFNINGSASVEIVDC